MRVSNIDQENIQLLAAMLTNKYRYHNGRWYSQGEYLYYKPCSDGEVIQAAKTLPFFLINLRDWKNDSSLNKNVKRAGNNAGLKKMVEGIKDHPTIRRVVGDPEC